MHLFYVCKRYVAELLSKWPLFGSSFFAVKRGGDQQILALNRSGVHFLHLITHVRHCNIHFVITLLRFYKITEQVLLKKLKLHFKVCYSVFAKFLFDALNLWKPTFSSTSWFIKVLILDFVFMTRRIHDYIVLSLDVLNNRESYCTVSRPVFHQYKNLMLNKFTIYLYYYVYNYKFSFQVNFWWKGQKT